MIVNRLKFNVKCLYFKIYETEENRVRNRNKIFAANRS